MRLEDLTVALRVRHDWEAADLGCAMVRREYPRLLLLWAVTVLPLWAVLAWCLWEEAMVLGFVIWWLKPLYDRVPLFYLSRVAFGVRPGLGAVLRAWPGLWWRFLLPALLWRRLSLARSVVLPVWMLEGIKGGRLRKRVDGLMREGAGAGMKLTYTFLKLELAVMLGVLMLTAGVQPDSGLPPITEWFLLDADEIKLSNAFLLWLYGGYALAVMLVEPFYVGAGFGVYLNCRTLLEGWDVELGFKRLAARLQGAVAVLLLMMGLGLGGELRAEDGGQREVSRAAASELVAEVLADGRFEHKEKTRRIWVWDEKEVESKEKGDASWIWLVLRALAYLTIVLLVGALLWLLIRVGMGVKALPRLSRSLKVARVQRVAGMDVRAEALPDDVVAVARALWGTGDQRGALSLLFRACISALLQRGWVEIEESDTEDDCVRKLRLQGGAAVAGVTGYCERLVRVWTGLAYAGRAPGEGVFAELCAGWPFVGEAEGGGRKGQRVRAVLALAVGLGLTGCKGHWEEVTEDVGYRGEARVNPFLALQEFLRGRGHEVVRRADLGGIREVPDGVLFLGAESEISRGRALVLLDWIREGGHLIYLVGGTRAYADWGGKSEDEWKSGWSAGYTGQLDEVLEVLDVSVLQKNRDEVGVKAEKAEKEEGDAELEAGEDGKVGRRRLPLRFMPGVWGEFKEVSGRWGNARLRVTFPEWPQFDLGRGLRRGERELRAEGGEGAVMLSVDEGRGRLTLVNHAAFMRNWHLGKADHALLADLLVGADELKEVVFVVGQEGSFWVLLWERGRWPLLALGLLLLLWLWSRVMRFGPLQAVELHSTRRFADHLLALGGYYQLVKRGDYLLRCARWRLEQKLRVHFPQVAAAGAVECRRFLAQRSGFSEAQVGELLDAERKVPENQVARVLQELQALTLCLL